MIEYIKHKAKEIEDELWEMLKSEYGLARNEETLARIHGTIESILDDGLQSAGLSDIPSDVDPDLEKIDELMALAMMAVAVANDEENPSTGSRFPAAFGTSIDGNTHHREVFQQKTSTGRNRR